LPITFTTAVEPGYFSRSRRARQRC
jgi:hypothetical protein